jgi:hypothetical protein
MTNISGLISAFPPSNPPSATDSKSGGENSAAPHDGRPDSFAAMLAGLSQPKEDAAAAAAKGTTTFKSFGSALPNNANSTSAETPGSEPAPAQLTPQSRRLASANLQLQTLSQNDPAVVASEAAAKAGGEVSAPSVTRAPLPTAENTSNAQSGGAAKTKAPAAQVPPPATNAKPLINAPAPPSVQADADTAADLADEQPTPAAPSVSGIGKRPTSTQPQSSDTAHKTDSDSAPSSATPNTNPQPAVVVPIIAAPIANAPTAPAAQSSAQQPRGAMASIDPGLAHNLSTRDRTSPPRRSRSMSLRRRRISRQWRPCHRRSRSWTPRPRS